MTAELLRLLVYRLRRLTAHTDDGSVQSSRFQFMRSTDQTASVAMTNVEKMTRPAVDWQILNEPKTVLLN